MAADKDQSIKFDSAGFFERMDGDAEMFNHILEIFKSGFPAHRTNLKKAIDANSPEELRKEAHSLWGELGILGHQPAIDATSALEDLGRAGQIKDAAAWLDKLEKAVQPILECPLKEKK